MANEFIARLKVDSQEYDNKIKNAVQCLQHLERSARDAGKSLNDASKEQVEYVRSLGNMETKATSARGKLSELTKGYTELSIQYRRMTDEEKREIALLHDYLAAGGDTYYRFAASPIGYDLGIPLDEVVMDYISAQLNGVIPADLYGQTQNRIRTISYSDVLAGDWFCVPVTYVTLNGLMQGTGDQFLPNAKLPTLRLKLSSKVDSLKQSKVFIQRYTELSGS